MSEGFNKPWLKATLKEINDLDNNKICLVQEPEKVDPATPCIYVYKSKMQSDEILENINIELWL